MINKMEIWNPGLLKKVEDEQIEVDPKTYEELSDKIIL